MVDKKTFTVFDMWQDYAALILKEDSTLFGKFQKGIRNYSVYRIFNGKPILIMDYKKFRKVIEHYFDKAKKEIISGNAINLYGGLGKVLAKRVERDFRSKKQLRINWVKTKKQPLIDDPDVPGKLKYKSIVYFTDPDWCRIAWFKNSNVTNIALYAFRPTHTRASKVSSFLKEFTEALNKDKLLKYRYLFQPLELVQEKREANKKSNERIRESVQLKLQQNGI